MDLPLGSREQQQAMRSEPVRGRNAEELRAPEQKASAVSERAPGWDGRGCRGDRGLRATAAPLSPERGSPTRTARHSSQTGSVLLLSTTQVFKSAVLNGNVFLTV